MAVALSLALPAAASAATKTVQVGPYGDQQKDFQAAFGDGNAFYRRTVTIHKNDSVRWKINGFHTVSFVPDGEQPPALLVPDATIPIAGSNDEAGNPFWFNGQPSLGFNPLGRVAARGQDV